MLNRLNHIAIAVTNLDEGIKIYKDTFGVQLVKNYHYQNMVSLQFLLN